MTDEQQPKKTTGEKIQDAQSSVDSARSFVDWIRDLVAWVRGFFVGN
jgi:hypothetical protein